MDLVLDVVRWFDEGLVIGFRRNEGKGAGEFGTEELSDQPRR